MIARARDYTSGIGSRMLASSEFGNRVLASAHKAAGSTKGVLGAGGVSNLLASSELGNLGGLLSSGLSSIMKKPKDVADGS
mmetsp:Transcript_25119/g.67371  ORF Transcript_25119/g.67371 Transcript_25119/m.67371 type:complete len:81 (+) Transcript_25119:1780-2022(+)